MSNLDCWKLFTLFLIFVHCRTWCSEESACSRDLKFGTLFTYVAFVDSWNAPPSSEA